MGNKNTAANKSDEPEEETEVDGRPAKREPKNGHRHNYPAMFLAYANGATFEEIATTFKVSPTLLKTYATFQCWDELAEKARQSVGVAALASVGTPKTDIDRAVAAIEDNRRKNLAVFEKLRAELVTEIDKLQRGEMKIQHLFSTKTGVVSYYRDPNMQDRVALATAAKIIAEGTYRAVGDLVSATDGSGKKDPGVGATISILIPGLVAGPKTDGPSAKIGCGNGEVIDLRPPPSMTNFSEAVVTADGPPSE